jgi:hypothetical protein
VRPFTARRLILAATLLAASAATTAAVSCPSPRPRCRFADLGGARAALLERTAGEVREVLGAPDEIIPPEPGASAEIWRYDRACRRPICVCFTEGGVVYQVYYSLENCPNGCREVVRASR